jgi:hypothetical protein
MPPIEQLLHTDVDHLSFGNGSNPSSQQDMECSEPALHGCVREYAQAHGEHQELCRVPRHASQGEPTVYSVLW